MAKLRFGYFIAPFHRAGTNPTLALQRDQRARNEHQYD